jgi:D-serine deaminase-like pyridoxal phosphate-dependent protein
MHISELIATPTLLLDKTLCRKHIERLSNKARVLGIHFRPHMKTPQSHEIARWLKDYHIDAITVSSLKMAHYFATDGWQDITVAFPVNIREIAAINELASKIKLQLCVENEAGIQALQQLVKHPVSLWLKINIGNNRTGLTVAQTDRLRQLIQQIESSDKLQPEGFLGHAGQSYQSRSYATIEKVHRESLRVMQFLKADFPKMKVSVGDTPTTSVMSNFPGVDEIRPGNFFFYDLMQYYIGSCQVEDIAVAMACPVVAKHYGREEIVLYGGAVHFSKDHLLLNGQTPCYGLVARRASKGWVLDPSEAYLCRLSQEHGIVKAPKSLLEETEIGSLMYILPVHSCLTANLMKQYLTLDGEWISMMS